MYKSIYKYIVYKAILNEQSEKEKKIKVIKCNYEYPYNL